MRVVDVRSEPCDVYVGRYVRDFAPPNCWPWLSSPYLFGNPYSTTSLAPAHHAPDGWYLPEELQRTTFSREGAVEAYAHYVVRRAQLDAGFKNALLNLYAFTQGHWGIRLGCWCKTPANPHLLCHGDFLAAFLNSVDTHSVT